MDILSRRKMYAVVAGWSVVTAIPLLASVLCQSAPPTPPPPRNDSQAIVHASWAAEVTVTPLWRSSLFQNAPMVDNPPPSRRFPQGVLQNWVPPAPVPVWGWRLTQDAPRPFRRDLSYLYSTWDRISVVPIWKAALLQSGLAGPAGGGQFLTVLQGFVVKSVSVTPLGLDLNAGLGTMSATGQDAMLLTGSAGTLTAGIASNTVQAELTGHELTVSQGILYALGNPPFMASATGMLVPSQTTPMVGEVSTGDQGLIYPNAAGVVPLRGLASVSATGTLLVPGNVVLVGSAIAVSPGTLSVTLRPTDIASQALVSAMGFIGIEANNVTVHITGSVILSAAGFVDSRPVLTGQVSTSAAGIAGVMESKALLGAPLVGSQGAFGVNQDPSENTYILSQSGEFGRAVTTPLTGSASTAATGSLAIGFDTFQPITGSATTLAAGTVGAVATAPLAGHGLVSAQESLGAPGFGVLSGLAVTSQQGTLYLNDDRARALLSSASTMTLGTLTHAIRPALTGQSQSVLAGQLGRSGGNMQFALIGQSSTWNTGTLAPSGGDDVETTATNEGCGIVSAVAEETEASPSAQGAEGCFVLAGTAREV